MPNLNRPMLSISYEMVLEIHSYLEALYCNTYKSDKDLQSCISQLNEYLKENE